MMPDPESGNIMRQRVWAALLCGGVGLFLWYVVWMRLPGLRAPPVIGYLAAGTLSLPQSPCSCRPAGTVGLR